MNGLNIRSLFVLHHNLWCPFETGDFKSFPLDLRDLLLLPVS